jgi:hypothetical protein
MCYDAVINLQSSDIVSLRIDAWFLRHIIRAIKRPMLFTICSYRQFHAQRNSLLNKSVDVSEDQKKHADARQSISTTSS